MAERKHINDLEYDMDLDKFVEEKCKDYKEDLKSKQNVVLHFNIQKL